MAKKLSPKMVQRVKEYPRAPRKKTKPRELINPWLDTDLANHALKVAKRQAIEAKISLITAELRVAEAELRCAEVDVMQHAGDVEFGRKFRENTK